MPVLEEQVRFRAGEATLAGTLTVPAAPPPEPRRRHPAVLLLASYLARDRDGNLDATRHPEWFAPRTSRASPGLLARLAAALADSGVATLRYDKRGCGESDGDWTATDWFTLVDDARDAIGFLRSRRELDLARFGIAGHGEGAAIALSVAIGDPAIGALTLIAPAARNLRDVLRRQAAARRRAPSRHAFVTALDRWSEDLIERAERREQRFMLPLPGAAAAAPAPMLALEGWHQAFHTPPIALATMLHRSVTLVHGDRDAWVAPDESALLEAALREAGNADVALRRIPRAGHELDEASDGDIDAIARDLASRLEARPLPPVLLAIEQLN